MPAERTAGAAKEIELLRAHPAASSGAELRTRPRQHGITRSYADAGGIQLGVRSAGREDASPLVVIGPAPGSASMLTAEIEQFAKTRRVLAFDAPGCGDSDSLPELSIPAMAAAIGQALDALGVEAADLYAFHGSCAVAFELAQASRRIRRTVLEAPARPHSGSSDYAARYAPPIEPRWDGSHLIALWHATRNRRLFRPWFAQRLEARYTGEAALDPVVINNEVLACLESWRTWHSSWHAVLGHPVPQAARNVRLAVRPSDEFFRKGAHAELPEPLLPRIERLLEMLGA